MMRPPLAPHHHAEIAAILGLLREAQARQVALQEDLERHYGALANNLLVGCLESLEGGEPSPPRPSEEGAAVQAAGAQARRVGQELKDNPYHRVRRTWRARAWESGWRAEDERLRLAIPDFLLDP